MPKNTRAQAAAIASAACKVPNGFASERGQLRLKSDAVKRFRAQSATDRGVTYTLGEAFEADGYLLIYDILDRLGVRIVRPISGNPFTIVCRHKTYQGSNQAELLLEILRDRLENFNYLGPGGFDEKGIQPKQRCPHSGS
jgi:hypothetical protein